MLLVVFCGATLSTMVFAPVDRLSDDDEVPAPKPQPVSFTQRKRRRLTREPVVKGDGQNLAESLQSKLDADCPCAQKTCLRQFLQRECFRQLVDYTREWHSLAKLDQDNIDPWTIASSFFCMMDARCWRVLF